MNWIDKLERKIGRYAVPNLMLYIIIMYGAGYVLYLINPAFYAQYLCLNAQAILHGQVWRIITFIIQPPSYSLIWMLVALSLYYFIGKELERAWGTFRFNLYFFAGVLFHVIAAILVYVLTGLVLPLGTGYLNMSLFLVYAAMNPNAQFMLYFIIPVKAKWLAWLDGAYFIWAVIQAFLPAYGGSAYGIYYKANALAAVVSILNFLIFFLNSRNVRPYRPSQVKRKNDFHRQVHKARPVNYYKDGARHRCAVCGRTELDDPKLEFRYCSKCNGNYEYCQEHLFTHKHVI